MDEGTIEVPLHKILKSNQETIVNIDGVIYEPIITLCHFTKLKEKIESQNSVVPEQVLISVKPFTVEPTFPFLEFIHCSTSNFSSVEKVIMKFDGSKVLYKISSQSIREELCFSELTNEESIQFDEK